MADCPICFETMNKMKNIIKTECGHEFHSNCFLTNVAHNGFGCPCCRKELATYPERDKEEDYDEYDYDDDNDDDDDDDDENDDDDDDDDDDEMLTPPLEYIIEKIQEKNYNKKEIIKLLIIQNIDEHFERYSELEEKFYADIDEICCSFNTIKKEQKEIELMKMEDKTCNYTKQNEMSKEVLLNDIESIINMRVY